jgi:AhpC/TSA family
MTRLPRVDRRMWLIAGVLTGLVLCGPAARAGQVRLLDLENRPVDPLHTAPDTRATVLLFVTTDCPISNRYAPEVARLFKSFASKGVSFWLIYPNPAESPQAIRDHLVSFGYPMRALRDPAHALAKLVRATVTPEAVVVVGERIVYRGRIDDRYVELGVQRPAPTRRDLEDALTAVLAGKAVQPQTTQAVGCVIADLLR